MSVPQPLSPLPRLWVQASISPVTVPRVSPFYHPGAA